MRVRPWVPYALCAPPLVVLLGLTLFPVGWNVVVSMHDLRLANLLRPWRFIGAENFVSLLGDRTFWESVRVSFKFILGSVTGQLIVGFCLARALAERLPGTGFFRAIFVFPWLLSAVVVAFSWRWMYHDLVGLLNFALSLFGLERVGWLSDPDVAVWSLVLTNVWFGAPFSMLFQGAALTTIDRELYEAAKVDGAAPWQQFAFITVPLITPFLAVNLILITMWTVNIFDLPLIMTKGGPLYSTTTVSLYMYRQAFEFGRLSAGAAVGFFLFAVNAVAAFVYVKVMGGRSA